VAQKTSAANRVDAPGRRCGDTLVGCVEMAHQYGQQALEALKPHVDKTAYTATLPEQTYTQEEREAMGENTDG